MSACLWCEASRDFVRRGRTFVASGKTECRDGADNAEHVMGEESDDFALGGIRPQEDEARAAGGYNLLLLGPRELANDGLGDAAWGLDGQGVQKHVRCRRHLGLCVASGPREDLMRLLRRRRQVGRVARSIGRERER